MEDQNFSLADYLDILKRRKWQFIAPSVLLSVVAVLVAVSLPAIYRSSATILIEQQEIPTDLVQTTVTSYADQRIQMISQRVMTRDTLSKLIERFDLYPDIPHDIGMGSAVERLRNNIALDTISAEVGNPRGAKETTIAFSLSFDHESPTVAQQVTSSLVSLFLTENFEQREAAVTETTRFLRGEADKLGEQVATLEVKLAAFKEEHSDTLPEFASINREMMARTESRLRDNAQSLQNLEQQKLYLESELSLRESTRGKDGQTNNPIRLRLQQLEVQYAEAITRYSPTHPDRARLEREISTLRDMVGPLSQADLEYKLALMSTELTELRNRYSDNHPNVIALRDTIKATRKQLIESDRRGTEERLPIADDPASVQLRTRLEAVQSEIGSLKQTRTQLEKELVKYEERVKATPKIEAQYRAITRDYDNAMHKYQELRDKVLQAELAQSLETNRKGERFTLIEPPLVSEQPIKPNRRAILLLGFILSIAAGVGHVALREALDKGIYGTRGLCEATRLPILGSVPYIETRQERRRRSLRQSLTIGGMLLTVALVLLIVHVFIRPLDVLALQIADKVESYLPAQGSDTR